MEKTLYEKGEGKYQSLYNYFKKERDICFDEGQLEDIIYRAIRIGTVDDNIGIRVERINHNEREKAFHDQWQRENIPISGINHGQGTLQDLFINRGTEPLAQPKWDLEITKRERMIVATVVQWLGSNCGMSFLEVALEKCGYKITPIEKR